ncbi:argininosuccinate lyase [Pandoraea terrae]|uniref:Argininosuccinate lyase n=1 Tax=Pandoraea terrae TaxID=1537710 RepID=A0A5E4ZFW8_9BURK|nr:argininosuccinate lyase [Pandoraea terrae]VVE59537.1 argininosuccinate lyase [Pandoraea terrae]
MPSHAVQKTWSPLFAVAAEDSFVDFHQCLAEDVKLAMHDIDGSLAHAAMLAHVGVLSDGDLADIERGLDQIRAEIESGRFVWRVELEDVHMNIEDRLTALVGEAGKRLHTARSRNDQIATDLRLYARSQLDGLRGEIDALCGVLLAQAERHADTVMPGFTHLQVAQPVTFGHHLMAYVAMLQRDRARFGEARERLNELPLGAAALAGTGYPIDRQFVAQRLGFRDVSRNSLDAVSDRDYVADICHAGAMLMGHLSRLSEELIFWATPLVGFIEIGDAFCTGSSIMPQKKNPDLAELVRGKAARVMGNHAAVLALMKGQPLAYNKDNQESKRPLIDTLETVRAAVRVFAAMLPTVQAQTDAMRAAADAGYSTATDMADYLVRRGLPFRDAHHVVAAVVRHASTHGKTLASLSLDELHGFSTAFAADVADVLTVDGSVRARDHVGGTAPAQVLRAVADARAALGAA